MYCPEGVYEFTGQDWTTGPIKNDIFNGSSSPVQSSEFIHPLWTVHNCVNTTLRADT